MKLFELFDTPLERENITVIDIPGGVVVDLVIGKNVYNITVGSYLLDDVIEEDPQIFDYSEINLLELMDPEEKIMTASFTSGDTGLDTSPFQVTNRHEQYQVLSAVIGAINKVMKTHHPNYFYYSTNDAKKARMYQTIAKKFHMEPFHKISTPNEDYYFYEL